MRADPIASDARAAPQIDILLLYCMMDADWLERKKGAMAVISEARERGIVRTHGTSSHALDALKTALRTPWVQVDLARINPAQVAIDAAPRNRNRCAP